MHQVELVGSSRSNMGSRIIVWRHLFTSRPSGNQKISTPGIFYYPRQERDSSISLHSRAMIQQRTLIRYLPDQNRKCKYFSTPTSLRQREVQSATVPGKYRSPKNAVLEIDTKVIHFSLLRRLAQEPHRITRHSNSYANSLFFFFTILLTCRIRKLDASLMFGISNHPKILCRYFSNK